MKKSINRYIPLLIGLLFCFSFGISLYTIFSLSKVSSSQRGTQVQTNLHIGLFVPENNYSFFQDVIKGAQAASTEMELGLSLHRLDGDATDLKMAKYSGITGAIIYPEIPQEQMRPLLRDLKEKEIPVVLIEHNITDENPWAFVGTNNFDLGKKIGELAERIGRDPLKAVVVYSEKSPGIYAERELVQMGILSVLGERLAGPLKFLKTDMNPLDAENLTSQILMNSPEVNLIVYTDSNDTLAAAQVIIDMNLVGKVQVIGFGSDEPLLDYIARGVVGGTIAVNPFDIGFRSVEVLYELSTTGVSESFVDTGVEIITKQNLPLKSESPGGPQ